MNAFLEAFNGLTDIENLREQLHKKRGAYTLAGCPEGVKAHVVYGVAFDFSCKIIVMSDEIKAKEFYEQYRLFEENVYYFPAKDLLFYQSDIRGNALTRQRMEVLEALVKGEKCAVVTTIDALMNKLPPIDTIADAVISVSEDGELLQDEFIRSLLSMGYEMSGEVNSPGQYCVRGGIIDVFPLTAELPIRIELWGDQIDSIRSFDPDTQKSLVRLSDATIGPAAEICIEKKELSEGIDTIKEEYQAQYDSLRKAMLTEESFNLKTMVEHVLSEVEDFGELSALEPFLTYFYNDCGCLLDYVPMDAVCFIDEVAKLSEKAKVVLAEFSDSMTRRVEKGYLLKGQLDMMHSFDEILAIAASNPLVFISTFETKKDFVKINSHYSVKTVGVNSYNGSFELLSSELKKYKNKKYKVLLLTDSSVKAKRLAEDLLVDGFSAFYAQNSEYEIQPGQIMVMKGTLGRGFEYPDSAFVVLSDSDIFGSTHHKKKKRIKRYEGEAISSFADLHVGDYVVHENYGLGIYRGTEQIEMDKIRKDYLKIEYAKGSNLYVLATGLDCIQKYSGPDGKKPKLNVLGTQEWNKTKAKVQEAVGVVAKELVELYAARQQDVGYVYGPDTVWQEEFEESFPFEETEGQIEAINAVKSDMMSTKIMDRLICGDVGFGKTEVAIRAAFKAVQENKQVVYLVPTTILAQQHYNNFVQRMGKYPVSIGLLCRFRTPAEQRETIAGLKKGSVDIVIGTHRLLSKDVEFKDLGLLIIDEEQRFGVSHKEKIKQLKQNVDVMSLSATPIPRTLHMSLIGIRDMSVLEEAPMERVPIQTFVFDYNEEMVREAITRELARGGQVYFVYNNIRMIPDMAAKIESLVPEASVAFAHGKMPDNQLEDIMLSFINKEIDVLVSTTIIETGLDIGNVNTIIIYDSDNMGLSQLYQLRGRVGRSNRTAYAYLLYRRDKMLKEIAEKRLSAIKEFSELGSGVKIAMRDLEIRGAGNLLGVEQHGHMSLVGYDLYCKMLNEAVKREKNETKEIGYNTVIDINFEAYIPQTYIALEEQRIDVYKRIALIDSQEERDDMLDELIDRFGEPATCIMNLLWVAMLRVKAHKAYITAIEEKEDIIKISLYEKAQLDVGRLPEFITKYSPKISFSADPKAPAFFYHTKISQKLSDKAKYEFLETFVEDLQTLVVE